MDTNDMWYVNCTHAQTNSQLNTLVWGSLTLAQLCRVLYRGEPGKSLPPNLGNNIKLDIHMCR